MPLAECLARIEARDASVRGWVHIDRDAKGGGGPLAGLVVGVKDVIDVAGMPTTHGSPIYAGNIAQADAEAVARLRAAGAVVLGKTVTAEFATYHPGPTANPRNLAHTPGGSSSGSAAVVADGQADIALGTQTAGSMIRPASFCGTFGFKPTLGRYPLAGVLETSPSLDTLGVFARNLAVLSAADAVLSGDDADPAAVASLTIGLCRSPAWDEASAEMQEAFLAFADKLRAAGHTVMDRTLPEPFDRLPAAQALVHRPPVIVLDEPTAGVDVELRQTLWQFVSRLNREGSTVLLTTHYLEEAEALCGRIAMLKQGRVVALEKTSELLRRASSNVLRFKTDQSLPDDLLVHARVTGRVVQLPAHSALEVEQLLARVRESGVVAEDIEIRKPDLEDVFIDVMGGAAQAAQAEARS